MVNTDRPYKVFQIDNGTVIDHVPHWKALQVVDLLKLRDTVPLVTMGIGLQSSKMGQKDLLKIEQRELTPEEMHRLALVAPDATINLIRDARRVHKQKVYLPDRVDGLVRCGNSGCITRHEVVPTRFVTESRRPVKLRCHYCAHVTEGEEIVLL